MKRLLIVSVALLAAMSSQADNYPYLSFQSSDGATLSMAVESLSMTFTDGGSQLVVANGSESHTLDVADLQRMFFSVNSATGISELAPSASDASLKAYTVEGVYVGTFSSLSDLEESVESGIYVVKTSGRTFKTAVR